MSIYHRLSIEACRGLSAPIPRRAAPPHPFEQLPPPGDHPARAHRQRQNRPGAGHRRTAGSAGDQRGFPPALSGDGHRNRQADGGATGAGAAPSAGPAHARSADHPAGVSGDRQPLHQRALEQRGVALLVGGSGLYLKALTSGLQPPAVAPQPQLRQQLTALGQGICHPLLQAADPKAAAKIAPADAVRTQRALEVLYASGQPMSRQATATPPPWRVLELGLNPANLRQRIQQRTEQLYRDGLVEETRRLSERYGADLPLLQTIGYGEALQVIGGSLSTADAVRITSQRTRQFAKRQRTWFRRQHNPHWLADQATLTDAMTLIEQHLR